MCFPMRFPPPLECLAAYNVPQNNMSAARSSIPVTCYYESTCTLVQGQKTACTEGQAPAAAYRMLADSLPLSSRSLR